tara:strand:+ start:156 stop:521 length:366 start_codon:yes stop_codon:yes gene_type:complete
MVDPLVVDHIVVLLFRLDRMEMMEEMQNLLVLMDQAVVVVLAVLAVMEQQILVVMVVLVFNFLLHLHPPPRVILDLMAKQHGLLAVAVEVYTTLPLVAKVEVQVDLTLEREMVLKLRPTVP